MVIEDSDAFRLFWGNFFFPILWIPGNSPKPPKRKSDKWPDSSSDTDRNDHALGAEWNDDSVTAEHSQEKNFETMWVYMHTLDRFIFEPGKVGLPLTGLRRMTGSLPLSKEIKKTLMPLLRPWPAVDSNGDSKCYRSCSDLRRHSFTTRVMHNSELDERPHLNTFRKLSSGKSGKQPVQQPAGAFRLGYFTTEPQHVSVSFWKYVWR